jgi:hypothetical protein
LGFSDRQGAFAAFSPQYGSDRTLIFVPANPQESSFFSQEAKIRNCQGAISFPLRKIAIEQ